MMQEKEEAKADLAGEVELLPDLERSILQRHLTPAPQLAAQEVLTRLHPPGELTSARRWLPALGRGWESGSNCF
jgi:hypothetical protein